MDPRRRIDEKYTKLEASKVPFIHSFRETVLEAQPLGKPIEREIIVIRIDRSTLRVYAFLFGVIALTIILTVGIILLRR